MSADVHQNEQAAWLLLLLCCVKTVAFRCQGMSARPAPSSLAVSTCLKPLAGASLQVIHVHTLVHEPIAALHLEERPQSSSLVLRRGAGEDLGKAADRNSNRKQHDSGLC